MGDLDGKAIIVTGAGRGIGAATAACLARLGARVMVNDIDAAAAQDVAQALTATGGTALTDGSDVTDWDQAAALVDHCCMTFGAVDGLVNNAGLFAMARLDELERGDFDRLMAVNVIGVAHCAAHAARVMRAQGSGSIVNVVSGAHMGLPAMTAYAASKGAVASMTYVWANELQGSGVRVNAVSPNGQTQMADIAGAYFARHGITAPGGGMAPEANAAAFAYLLSDRSAHINGQLLRIEGEQLSLIAHPTILLPVMERAGGWTVETVGDAFDAQLAARQSPLGIIGADIAGYGPASRMWARDDQPE